MIVPKGEHFKSQRDLNAVGRWQLLMFGHQSWRRLLRLERACWISLGLWRFTGRGVWTAFASRGAPVLVFFADSASVSAFSHICDKARLSELCDALLARKLNLSHWMTLGQDRLEENLSLDNHFIAQKLFNLAP